MEHLHNFETMDETAIRNTGSHQIDIANLCKEARDRLVQIEQDDIDYLMSFRVTGRRRVWCRVIENIMLVLWWDPDHKVCPSILKHT